MELNIESRSRPTHNGQLVFKKDAKTTEWEKDHLFSKQCWNKRTPLCKNLTLSTYLTPQTKRHSRGFPGGSDSKESACQCRRHRFDPWIGKIPWRRKWQPTPVFLPGKSNGQRSLAGYYGPWGHKRIGLDLATKQQ